jgi:hypothetical protein
MEIIIFSFFQMIADKVVVNESQKLFNIDQHLFIFISGQALRKILFKSIISCFLLELCEICLEIKSISFFTNRNYFEK